MSLLLADLITETRTILNEATAAFYSDAMITAWLNQGARDLALKARVWEVTSTISVVSGTMSYAFPTDAFYIHSVFSATTGLALTRIDPQKAGHIIGTATAAIPLYYWAFNHAIYVTPMPSASVTLTVLFAKSTESVLDIPDEFRLYLIDYAVARGLIRDSNAIEALALMNIYNNNVQFVRRDVTERGVTSIDELTLPDTKLRPQASGG